MGIRDHEIVGSLDLDFEWSCCLALETERCVLVGNEWENSGSVCVRQ